MKFSFKLNERICSDRLLSANKYLNLHLNIKRFFFPVTICNPFFLGFSITSLFLHWWMQSLATIGYSINNFSTSRK